MPPFTFAVIMVLRPGDVDGLQATESGPVWKIGAQGEIYRDGVQIPGAARFLLLFGTDVYSQGKTVPSWWRWDGAKWVAASINLDSLVTLALTAPPPVMVSPGAATPTPKAAPKVRAEI